MLWQQRMRSRMLDRKTLVGPLCRHNNVLADTGFSASYRQCWTFHQNVRGPMTAESQAVYVIALEELGLSNFFIPKL